MVFLQCEQFSSVSVNGVLQKGHGVAGSSISSISPNLFRLGGFLTTASIFFWYFGSTFYNNNNSKEKLFKNIYTKFEFNKSVLGS